MQNATGHHCLVINTTVTTAKTTLSFLMTVTQWHNSGPAQAAADNFLATPVAPLWPSPEKHQSHTSGRTQGPTLQPSPVELGCGCPRAALGREGRPLARGPRK